MKTNEDRCFVRSKQITKILSEITGKVGLFCIFLSTFLLFDYLNLKYADCHSRDLAKEVRDLKSELNTRDQQLEDFSEKINVLELKLLKLHDMEQEIRSFTGLNDARNMGDYGIGGLSIEDPGETIRRADGYPAVQNLNGAVAQMDRRISRQSEEFQRLWETLREIKTIQQLTPSIRPVDGGWISSSFGYRQSPFSDKREFHSGVDIAVHKGTPVKATAAGTVRFAGSKGSLGKAIIIDHGFGIETRYGHLNACHVRKGQKVKRGDVIAAVGNTGRSTGPHLHYEVRFNDIPVNAEKYMSQYLVQNDPS